MATQCAKRCNSLFEYNTSPTDTHTTLKPCRNGFCFHARDRQAHFFSVGLTFVLSLHFAARDLAFLSTLMPPTAFYPLLAAWIYSTLLSKQICHNNLLCSITIDTLLVNRHRLCCDVRQH